MPLEIFEAIPGGTPRKNPEVTPERTSYILKRILEWIPRRIPQKKISKGNLDNINEKFVGEMSDGITERVLERITSGLSERIPAGFLGEMSKGILGEINEGIIKSYLLWSKQGGILKKTLKESQEQFLEKTRECPRKNLMQRFSEGREFWRNPWRNLLKMLELSHKDF